MYRSIREASKALKEVMTNLDEGKGTLKDYDKMIVCAIMGDFTPMFTTKLYIKHSAEFCEALSHVDEICIKIPDMMYISDYMSTDMLKGYFATGSKVLSYGGDIDTVIGFNVDVPVFGWSVTVKDSKGNVRSHSTSPSQVKDLKMRRKLSNEGANEK